ncbi:MAG: ABC transporter ATP-binding protein [Gammaproteobacteria bacterium]|nr:ABC transporter ATP-binding protein [Gammaproteobacteria bacterium]
MTAILEVRALVKQFPGTRAVDGLDLAIEEGICFGLLGPNGAGKTTTIEIIEGITRASSGEVLYKGDPQGQAFKEEAGIQFQSTALQDFQTVRETLEMFGALYPGGMDVEELVDLCALGGFLDQDARKVSGGQRQRLLLAIALVNDPDIIFLDEPTTGLDPQARRNFWELIERIKARRKTILLTTHYMEEAYRLCDEIAIMDHGRIIAQGTPRALLKQHFDDSILELPAAEVAGKLENFPFTVYEEERGKVAISTGDVNAAVAALLQRDVSLGDLEIRARTLEDLFLELTGKELRA